MPGIVLSTTPGTNTGAVTNVPVPSNAIPGDVIVVRLTKRIGLGSVWTIPSDWSMTTQIPVGSAAHSIAFWHTVKAGEPGTTLALTSASATAAIFYITLLAGVNPTPRVVQSSASVPSTPITIPAAAVINTELALTYWAAQNGSGAYSKPAGETYTPSDAGNALSGNRNTNSSSYAGTIDHVADNTTILAAYTAATSGASGVVLAFADSAPVTPPVGGAFPWKGLGTARPWLGLGTDDFKGVA